MTTFDARDLNLKITPLALKSLFQINPYRHGAALAGNWLIILTTIFLAWTYFHAVTYILAVLIIGARMHALAISRRDT